VNNSASLAAPDWLLDADLMGELVRQRVQYLEVTADPILGMYSNDFRVAHRLVGDTFFNSKWQYRKGDAVDLGTTLNLEDKQKGRMLARVLGPVETPPEYRHYLIYEHTYCVLVD
jgi:hypothetical protein